MKKSDRLLFVLSSRLQLENAYLFIKEARYESVFSFLIVSNQISTSDILEYSWPSPPRFICNLSFGYSSVNGKINQVFIKGFSFFFKNSFDRVIIGHYFNIWQRLLVTYFNKDCGVSLIDDGTATIRTAYYRNRSINEEYGKWTNKIAHISKLNYITTYRIKSSQNDSVFFLKQKKNRVRSLNSKEIHFVGTYLSDLGLLDIKVILLILKAIAESFSAPLKYFAHPRESELFLNEISSVCEVVKSEVTYEYYVLNIISPIASYTFFSSALINLTSNVELTQFIFIDIRSKIKNRSYVKLVLDSIYQYLYEMEGVVVHSALEYIK